MGAARTAAAVESPQLQMIAPIGDTDEKGNLVSGGLRPVVSSDSDIRPTGQPGHVDGLAPTMEVDDAKRNTESATKEETLADSENDGSKAGDTTGRSGRTGDDLGDGEPVGDKQMPQMPEGTASVRYATTAPLVADEKYTSKQMPNTTNAKTEDIESVDFTGVAFAKPTGWGKLWRIERNGNYFIYRLRFVDSAETPKEYRRITRKGGRITPQIEAKFNERKGRGRHAESRTDADRFRGRAFDLAKRIRASD